jgi:hypothetical protein
LKVLSFQATESPFFPFQYKKIPVQQFKLFVYRAKGNFAEALHMTPSIKKISIFAFLCLLITGAVIGYYMFTKGPRDVKNASATKVTARTLYQSFSQDSATAQKKYTDKILETSGLISQVTKNQQGISFVMLTTNEDGAYINCTMEGPSNEVKANDSVTIKGICSGIQADNDLGIKGDVYLTRCYIIK